MSAFCAMPMTTQIRRGLHSGANEKSKPLLRSSRIIVASSGECSDHMASANRTGADGEKIARKHLRRKGYLILESNWSTTFGELDIIAKQGNELVFVEVKTRRGASTEVALEAVTPAKRERMLKAVYQYLHDHDIDSETQWRMDVIAVAIQAGGPPQIDHVEDAFDW